MSTTYKQVREIPVRYNTGVLVVGGGLTGVCAAVAAAEMGEEVILVERNGRCGGNFTSSLVSTFCAYHVIEDGEEKPVSGGLAERIFTHLQSENSLGRFIYHSSAPVVPVDGPVLIRFLDEMLVKAGVKVLFHQTASNVVMDKNRVEAVLFTEKGGEYAIKCKTVIDCTGDGDVAFMAGIPVLTDSPVTQFPSLVFHIGGVDFEKASKLKKPDLERLQKQVVESGEFDLPRTDGTLSLMPRQGIVQANLGLIKIGSRPISALSSEDMSYGQMEGRRQAFMYLDFVRKHIPGYENAFICKFPITIGIRETRRMKGNYILTKDDFLAARKFDDGIACSSWPIELHREKDLVWVHLPPGEYLEVPFRCLIPEDVENLLFAGRCLSADQNAHAAVRCGPTCMSMGEAAGIGAATLSKDGGKAKNLDGSAIRRAMRERGAHFPKEA